MIAVQLDIPEETLISLKTDAESFARDLKLLAAVKLFELGKLSSGGAAPGHPQCLTGWSSAAPRHFSTSIKSGGSNFFVTSTAGY